MGLVSGKEEPVIIVLAATGKQFNATTQILEQSLKDWLHQYRRTKFPAKVVAKHYIFESTPLVPLVKKFKSFTKKSFIDLVHAIEQNCCTKTDKRKQIILDTQKYFRSTSPALIFRIIFN